MADKWVISDTHFLHANILKFTNKEGQRIRPFNSLEEMHETMIERWNSVVMPSDYVYHLGDVTFQYNHIFNEIMSRLNGKKRLLVGNHDKIMNPNLHRWFDKIELWKGFKDLNFTMSHMPLKDGHFRDGAFNVHGHLHSNLVRYPDGTPDARYISACVEVLDYTPMSFDTIIEIIKQRVS